MSCHENPASLTLTLNQYPGVVQPLLPVLLKGWTPDGRIHCSMQIHNLCHNVQYHVCLINVYMRAWTLVNEGGLYMSAYMCDCV